MSEEEPKTDTAEAEPTAAAEGEGAEEKPAEPEPEAEKPTEPEPEAEKPAEPEPEPEPEPKPAEPEPPAAAQLNGDPGFVKVTVDQSGKVGVWTAKPNSILHMHSDDLSRPAQVTVTGATAGFTFGARTAPGELSEVKGEAFEIFAEENEAVIATAGTKVAAFDADGNARMPGKVHAESFETTSTRSAKTDIAALPAQEAFKVLEGLTSVSYEFKRSGEKHLGFIAEDVPDEVANADHTSVKMGDIISVLACCVKEQQKTIQQLTERLEKLER